jgi:hypothetical protein
VRLTNADAAAVVADRPKPMLLLFSTTTPT